MNQPYSLMFANKVRVHFHASKVLHLPKYLSQHGLANYEPLSVAAFMAYAEETPGAIFDVGANIGVYTLLAATGLRRNVVAFEPFTEPATILKTLALEHDLPIDVMQMAVSETAGASTFYLSTKSDMSNSLNADFRDHRGTLTVQTTTLDSIGEKRVPAIIKIDTETTEMDVLRGGANLLKRDRPAVLVEVLTPELEAEVREFFAPLNYQVIEIGSPSFQERFQGTERYATDGDERNWLLIPTEKELGTRFYKRANEWLEYIRKLAA